MYALSILLREITIKKKWWWTYWETRICSEWTPHEEPLRLLLIKSKSHTPGCFVPVLRSFEWLVTLTDQTWTKFEPMHYLRYWRSFRLDRNDFFPYLGSSPCSSSSERSVGSFPEQQLAINTSVSRKTLQSSVLRQTVTKRINGIKVDLKRPFIWVRLTC